MDDQSKNGINFGHGAAINGAFSVDSHNTTIHQAQKSLGELEIEKRKLFKQQCEMMIQDGRINALEAKTLESFRLSIGLDKEVAAKILNEAKNLSTMAQEADLDPIQRMTLNQVIALAKGEKITLLKGSLPRLEAMLLRTPIAEVSFYFNMLSVGMQPEQLLTKFEHRVSDDYWQTYWAYVAYFNAGDGGKAEMAFADLKTWQEYPFGNMALLASVGLLYQYRTDPSLTEFKEQAEMFLNQGPEDHSEYLEPLANILLAVLQEDTEALQLLEKEHPFYFHYLLPKLLQLPSPEVKEKVVEDIPEPMVEEVIAPVEEVVEEVVAEEERCSVRLLDCGTDQSEVVDAICEISSMDKKDVERLVTLVPCIVLENIDCDDAEEFSMVLDAVDAKCEMVAATEKIDKLALRRPLNVPDKIDFGGIFSRRLEQLMATVLEDGVLTAKGKQMVIKRAEKEDEDVDEVLMVLDGKIAELGLVDASED